MSLLSCSMPVRDGARRRSSEFTVGRFLRRCSSRSCLVTRRARSPMRRRGAGLLETADGGTAFLDEIGEISSAVQVKLLRVLEDGLTTRSRCILTCARLDVRFVAATHRDLAKEVEAGRFRRDLFYRLGGCALPRAAVARAPGRAARDRPRAARAMRRARRQPRRRSTRRCSTRWPGTHSRKHPRAAQRGRASLRAVRWQSVVRRARDGLVERRPSTPPAPPPMATDQDVRTRVVAALEQCAGNQTRAAKLLQVSRRTLVSWSAIHRIPLMSHRLSGIAGAMASRVRGIARSAHSQ